MNFSTLQQKMIVAIFCCLIAVPGALHLGDLLGLGKDIVSSARQNSAVPDTTSIETTYGGFYTQDDVWVNLYGLANGMMLKDEVANFSVIRDSSGSLYIPESIDDRAPVDVVVSNINALSAASERVGANFLFAQPAYKTYTDVAELSDYAISYLDSDYDEILKRLDDLGVSAVDLRDVEDCCDWYKTDHHWTCEASFAAANYVIGCLANVHGMALSANQQAFLDLSNYEEMLYENSFLGSAGVKVGSWYEGKDDFSYFAPTWNTNFTYEHYVGGKLDGSYSGSFEDAFIDESLLTDKEYNNKYNAFLRGGYVESVIVNHDSENNLKLLFVAHSYGRPMVQYLSLFFGEVVYLDPQDGRFNENYVEYIENYQPDYVVVMYDGEINIGE